MKQLVLGKVVTDLVTRQEALDRVRAHLVDPARRPLAVESTNLDHFTWFPHGSHDRSSPKGCGGLDWLTLVDGFPVMMVANRATGASWERLTGADLLEPMLAVAEEEGRTVGFFGGMPAMHEVLRGRLAEAHPTLRVAGCWAPERAELADPARARALAQEVREAGVDLLAVGLGKPRQEQWILEHGQASGARVLLAFGAAADFLAGVVVRAPAFYQEHHLEWAYRLAKEPRRMARRYLVQGPRAAAHLVRYTDWSGVPR